MADQFCAGDAKTLEVTLTICMIRKKQVRLGLEKLLEESSGLVKGTRVGLICNQASVNHGLQHAADLLHHHPDIQVTALFGPQHGIRGDVQDNMIETAH